MRMATETCGNESGSGTDAGGQAQAYWAEKC